MEVLQTAPMTKFAPKVLDLSDAWASLGKYFNTDVI